MPKQYHHEAGKGSKQRPVDKEKYEENFDKIFRKEKEKQDKPYHWVLGSQFTTEANDK